MIDPVFVGGEEDEEARRPSSMKFPKKGGGLGPFLRNGEKKRGSSHIICQRHLVVRIYMGARGLHLESYVLSQGESRS